MRKTIAAAAILAFAISAPAAAIGLEDLAKVVLGNSSVLKKAEQRCGRDGQLTLSENTTISTAIGAVRQALAPDRFTALDNVARADADTQAQTGTFCPETKKKKKGLLSKIGKAGRRILTGGIGI